MHSKRIINLTGLKWIFILSICLIIAACKNEKLPILGQRSVENNDTIYARTPDFSFQNQFGEFITKDSIKGKIHVANFFFTSCPTICPKVTRQMLRVYKEFENDDSE